MSNLEQKVFVLTRNFRGVPGYDLVIRDPGATVQDYLDALNAAIARLPLRRNRRRGTQDCAGCDRCCAERAPLTIVDCLRLREALEKATEGKSVKGTGKEAGRGAGKWAWTGGGTGGKPGGGKAERSGREAGIKTGGEGGREPAREIGEKCPESWDAFFDRYTTVTVQGPVVDIVLKRNEDGRCIFLDRRTKLCRVYSARPFVCQTFICSPAARRALELREALVNKGEDELVRLWLTTGMVIHQAHHPRPDPRDWPPTPFAGKTRYGEVLLREVLPGRIWQKLNAN
ncbi:MAG: YkgJ family cysteine cluster protein [Bacillota bacterium]